MTVNEVLALRPLIAAAAAGAAQPAPESVLLAGQVGAEVAASLSSALERVELLIRSGRIGQHSLQALHNEISQARRVAILGQQVTRLATGEVHQTPEVLELSQRLREAVAARSDDIAARGVELRQLLQPAAVSLDPTLLHLLLLSLLDWALAHSCTQTVTVTTSVNTWPVHAVLNCDFVWRAPDRLGPNSELAFEAARQDPVDDGTALNTMAWRLMEQACQALNVRIDRQDSPCNVHLSLAFPEAPHRWPAMHALDETLDVLGVTGEGSSMGARPLAGCRALVLACSPQARSLTGDKLGSSLAALGLLVDVVANLHDAREVLRGTAHDVLVTDCRNSEVDRLLAELKAGGSGPALVQVCDVEQALEISTSGQFEVVRLGADHVARDLPDALRYALGAR